MRKDYNLEKRKYVIGGFIVLIVAIYIIRLYNLQLSGSEYQAKAESNAFVEKTIYPSRGLIYDRNGKLIVYNRPAYDLVFIPKDVLPFDTLDMCNTLKISREEFEQRMNDIVDKNKNHNYSAYTEQILMHHLSTEDYGRIQEKLYRFPGFFIVKRTIREYNYACAANVLGDIREVNARDIENDTLNYYKPGDYTGDLGVEKSYEKYLRGRKGVEILMRDAVGKIQGRYNNGADDVEPIPGNDLKLSIDIELQQFGEELMRGKSGAIVCIEPKTGEVLAIVSSPNYDPSLLVGKERGKNYSMLVQDPARPLFDRSIMAAYPPGSTFKPSQGLIFLQEGIITTSTAYPCSRGFISGGLRVGCHGHGSPIPLIPAISTSCNAYFCWGLKHMLDRKSKYGSTSKAFEIWKNYMVSMGYGYKLDIDLPGESRGFIPNSAYYDKAYGKDKWISNTIISIAIGQGEVLATPLQIANLGATIANRGYFITPHVVKNIESVGNLKKNLERHDVPIDKEYYEDIVKGMRSSVLGGTCRHANLPGLELCGKTGTAQNPHGPDHSVFMGFAPMNDPKIVVAVYVENGGWGATFGVPIGSLMIEKYLNGKVARTDLASRMMNTSVLGRAGRQPGSKTKAKSVNKTNNESSQATATQESSNGAKTE